MFAFCQHVKEIPTPHQYVLVSDHPEKYVRFNALKYVDATALKALLKLSLGRRKLRLMAAGAAASLRSTAQRSVTGTVFYAWA